MAILIVLYVIFGGGMIWGYTTSKKKPNKPLPKFISILSAAAIVIVAIASPWIGGDGNDRGDLENQYRRAYLKKLGESLGQKVVGSGKVLVIHGFDEEDENGREMLENSLKYLEEGFGDKAEIVHTENPNPPHNMESEETEEIIIKGKDLNKLIKRNKDCNIVVFLSSLPYSIQELKQMEIFYFPPKEDEDVDEDEEDDDPFPNFDEKKLPLLGLTVSTNLRKLKFLIKEHRIDVAVAWNPNVDLSKEKNDLSDDLNETFDKRYLLIDSDNVESTAKKFPKIFSK